MSGHSTSATSTVKPERPPGSPLFWHATGRCAKKIRGRLVCFGRGSRWISSSLMAMTPSGKIEPNGLHRASINGSGWAVDRAGANKALHLTGPALRFFETSRSLQPARQVNAVIRRRHHDTPLD